MVFGSLQSDELLGDKELLEVLHLPESERDQDDQLEHGPHNHSLTSGLASVSESLLALLKQTRLLFFKQTQACVYSSSRNKIK